MLTITVDDKNFRTYLQELHSRLDNLTPVMEEIGSGLENRVRRRFETATDPTGAAWEPWDDSTLETYPFPGTKSAARTKYGAGNARLLDRSGTMLGSLNYQADPTSVTIGFANDYAVYHEFGTRKMPRRGMLMDNPTTGTLGEADERLVLDLLTEWLTAP